MASNIIYPISLPCPNLAGNKMQGGDTFKRSIFDHAIRQRKSYCGSYELSYQFTTINAAQMQDFTKFYYETLGNGVKSFIADWEVEGNIVQKEFRFSSIYSATSIGKSIYRISANFELITNIKDF